MKATLVDGTQAEGTPEEIAALIQVVRDDYNKRLDLKFGNHAQDKPKMWLYTFGQPLPGAVETLAQLVTPWATEIACSVHDYVREGWPGSWTRIQLSSSQRDDIRFVNVIPDSSMPIGKIEVRK